LDPQEKDFWCEIPSNDSLDPKYELGTSQISHLAALGWNPPEGAGGIPNWWYVDSDAGDVAELMVRTLSEVCGALLDKPFKIKKSWKR
jgi:hypothetical protein